MNRLFVSQNLSEVRLLQSMLLNEGIESMVRNEQIAMTAGSVPFNECTPELWVAETDWAAASAILVRWQAGPGEEFLPWTCPQCGKLIEGQFGECWNCGHALGEAESTGGWGGFDEE